jgi:hypothetical protein
MLMKLHGLTEICLNKTCNEVLLGKYLPDTLPIHTALKYEDFLSSLLCRFAYHS